MVLFFWITCLIIFIASGLGLLAYVLKTPEGKDSWKTLTSGFKEGLRGSGILSSRQRHYKSELYVWEVEDEHEVSDECLDRSCWPAMDIADWMAEGLPGTPESGINCGPQCHCKLTRYDPKKHPHKNPHNFS